MSHDYAATAVARSGHAMPASRTHGGRTGLMTDSLRADRPDKQGGLVLGADNKYYGASFPGSPLDLSKVRPHSAAPTFKPLAGSVADYNDHKQAASRTTHALGYSGGGAGGAAAAVALAGARPGSTGRPRPRSATHQRIASAAGQSVLERSLPAARTAATLESALLAVRDQLVVAREAERQAVALVRRMTADLNQERAARIELEERLNLERHELQNRVAQATPRPGDAARVGDAPPERLHLASRITGTPRQPSDGGGGGTHRSPRPVSAAASPGSHLVDNLKREVQNLTATRDALAAQLADIKTNSRAQRLAELQAELQRYKDEAARQAQMGAVVAKRLDAAEAELAEARAAVKATKDKTEALAATTPLALPAENNLSKATVRNALVVLNRASNIILAEAKLLRSAFPPLLSLPELRELSIQRSSTSGAVEALVFVNSHLARLLDEMRGLPGVPRPRGPPEVLRESDSQPAVQAKPAVHGSIASLKAMRAAASQLAASGSKGSRHEVAGGKGAAARAAKPRGSTQDDRAGLISSHLAEPQQRQQLAEAIDVLIQELERRGGGGSSSGGGADDPLADAMRRYLDLTSGSAAAAGSASHHEAPQAEVPAADDPYGSPLQGAGTAEGPVDAAGGEEEVHLQAPGAADDVDTEPAAVEPAAEYFAEPAEAANDDPPTWADQQQEAGEAPPGAAAAEAVEQAGEHKGLAAQVSGGGGAAGAPEPEPASDANRMPQVSDFRLEVWHCASEERDLWLDPHSMVVYTPAAPGEWPMLLGRRALRAVKRIGNSLSARFFAELARKQETEQLRLGDLLAEYSSEGDGLSDEDFERLARDLLGQQLSPQAARFLMTALDLDGDRRVAREEMQSTLSQIMRQMAGASMEDIGRFQEPLVSLLNRLHTVIKADMQAAWDLFCSQDRNGNYALEPRELKRFFEGLLGPSTPQDDVRVLLTHVHLLDLDANGRVGWRELLIALRLLPLHTPDGGRLDAPSPPFKPDAPASRDDVQGNEAVGAAPEAAASAHEEGEPPADDA